ncbi:MAG: 2Fe-2S iron-sulfur cluster binding domain-containing protein [Anaerolineae bacterium]|nr:2Fe-2S iron-sulfur cluster binding domain-containing protein [Gloeobacterales cyanobacterium ES-bin-313]
MTTHTVCIHDHQSGRTVRLQIASDQYVLMAAEAQAVTLPYSCRNGACTACAVRILEGDVHQPEAMGLSPELKAQGYALLCVSYPASDLVVETQNEDEVYELQFGRYFGQGKVQAGLPLEGD